MTLETTDVADRRRRPRRLRRRRLPAPARPPRAGARTRAVPALLRSARACCRKAWNTSRPPACCATSSRPASSTRTARPSRGATSTPTFDFRDKFSEGWGTTYQVQRATFDKVLADAAARMGAEIRFRHEVTAIDLDGDKPRVVGARRRRQRVRGRGALRARRQRLRPHAAAPAQARDAVQLPGARRDLHARRRPHPAGRPVRSPEDPRDGASAAPRRLVLDDPVLQRPLLDRRRRRAGLPRAVRRHARSSACARSWPRSRACPRC